MRKIKSLLLAFILVVTSNCLEAQYIRVLPVSATNISNTAAEMLYNRLNQVVTLNGIKEKGMLLRRLLAAKAVSLLKAVSRSWTIFILQTGCRLALSKPILLRATNTFLTCGVTS